MRVRLMAAATLLAVTGLTACGKPAASDGPVSLRMTTWSANEAHLALFKEIADEYRGSHPNVTQITIDPLPLDTYATTLTTQIAGNSGPDLAWILESSAPDFVASGALVPLDDPLKKADGYRYDALAPAATRLWTSDGRLY